MGKDNPRYYKITDEDIGLSCPIYPEKSRVVKGTCYKPDIRVDFSFEACGTGVDHIILQSKHHQNLLSITLSKKKRDEAQWGWQ
jgi:hypothetical protein